MGGHGRVTSLGRGPELLELGLVVVAERWRPVEVEVDVDIDVNVDVNVDVDVDKNDNYKVCAISPSKFVILKTNGQIVIHNIE